VLCTITLGFLLEGGQSFVPGREMSLADGIVNTCGVTTGMLLFNWQGRAVENWLSSLLA
jgi:VanZ family protein